MNSRRQHAMAAAMAVAIGFAPLPSSANPASPQPQHTVAAEKQSLGVAPSDPALAGLPADASALGGYNVLIADRGNNRLLLVSPQKQILWEYHFKGFRPGSGADDAFFADNGKSIIASDEHQQVVQIIDMATKTVTWQYGTAGRKGSRPGLLDYPDDAYKLPNGDVLVADIRNCRIIEISQQKQIVRQMGKTRRCWGTATLASPNGDKPLPGGHVLVSTISDHSISELDGNGVPVFKLKLPIRYPSDPQMTKAGNIIVVGYTRPGKLIEIGRDGKIVWAYKPRRGGQLNHPSIAMELPDGNVLVTDDLNQRVVVIDKKTNAILWQYGVTHHRGSRPGYLHVPDGVDIQKIIQKAK